mmetsp:Transcript_11024/g.18808  ORF Transcript_11024/g.18808 Transcript_11024/m.18808 type:complete len:124 (+) Transcript_11024:135-506(+)|eukprot:CAMPEP_0206179286 /NCGR_PEP_ID=MMETSP1474-20131121/67044_1 /ASSEMBLY_ACC=CAM_ASM_001110 /TAXON_ID=97495 /ORGANISM="Imantonia sp., Strain RCC918" /LENGTH=123 /DNA_ID=CAMNT_0053592459 /DNA_START=136 /DNA_END=507 /DNA_ORIENTATION=+
MASMVTRRATNHPEVMAAMNEMEVAFERTRNGTFKTDARSLERVENLLNCPTKQLWIELVTGVPLPEVHFEAQGQGDIEAMHRNKVLVTRLYGICYVFYWRICKTTERRMAAGMLPPGLLEAA